MSVARQYVLRANGLTKRYGTLHAVHDLDLGVRRGEIYGFLGPNGAGKTTTLLMLIGIEQPTAGRIERFGRAGPFDPFRDGPRIGIVGEHQYFYDDMSAWEYLLFFGRLYGVGGAARRAGELLERLDLLDFRRLRARDFSRGMQQKLGLARALLHEPELLVLDEPVSGLDPHGIRQVREILTEQNRRGTTILLSSHILSEIERTAHRVGVLHGGRLVAEDDVARLSARLEPDPVIEMDVERLRPTVVSALRELTFVRDVQIDSRGDSSGLGLLRIRVSADGDYRRDVSAVVAGHGGLITGMRVQRLSLEEAFVRLTTEAVDSLVGDAPPPVRLAADDPLDAHDAEAEPAPDRWALRWRAVKVIGRRDFMGMVHGPSTYVVVALGMLATLPIVAGYLDAVERNGVLVLADAFTLPFFAAATITMLYLALASVATIAREKDQGTLEVLFYGPVDVCAYVLAKHLAHVLAYLLMVLGLGALLAAYAGMSGLRLSGAFVPAVVLSVFTAASVTALGACLSTLARGVRAAVALLGVLAVLFLAIRFGGELLSGIAVTSGASPLLFLRNLVLALDDVVSYLSPFSGFQAGVDAAVRGEWVAYGGMVLLLCLQAAVLLTAATWLLQRRGVRR